MHVKVTYLQMFARPDRVVPPPRDGLLVLHVKRPSVAYYRFLYHFVGGPWQWQSRKKLSDDELARVLGDARNEAHVLHVDGSPAGFVEFDRHTENEIEIVQFGLMPEYIGQGLGRYFLWWAVEKAWSYAPSRLWLHTCDLDHPNAIPNYLKAGFVVYKEEVKER